MVPKTHAGESSAFLLQERNSMSGTPFISGNEQDRSYRSVYVFFRLFVILFFIFTVDEGNIKQNSFVGKQKYLI